MNSSAVVHLIDDDESLRTAVTRVLSAAGHTVRGYASCGDFLMAESRNEPGCLILDVRMPGPSGLELQEALNKQSDPLPIIFLTGHGDVAMSVRAMKAGAVDFLTKPVQREQLLSAVAAALSRSANERASRLQLKTLRTQYAALSPREREVLHFLLAGKLNKQIASLVGIAERTVKAHRAQLMQKMQVASLAELIVAASQLGLVGISDAPPNKQ